MSRPLIESSVSSMTSTSSPANGTRLPADRADASGTSSETGKLRSASDLEQRRSDGPGRAQDSDPVAHGVTFGLCSAPVGSSLRTASAPSSNASCSAFTASGTRSSAITQEILIGDVAIISMLI